MEYAYSASRDQTQDALGSPYEPAHEIILSHRRPAHPCNPELSLFAHLKHGSRRSVRPKNQTSSSTEWLRMRVWIISLRRTKSTITSWDGSYIFTDHGSSSSKNKETVLCELKAHLLHDIQRPSVLSLDLYLNSALQIVFLERDLK